MECNDREWGAGFNCSGNAGRFQKQRRQILTALRAALLCPLPALGERKVGITIPKTILVRADKVIR